MSSAIYYGPVWGFLQAQNVYLLGFEPMISCTERHRSTHWATARHGYYFPLSSQNSHTVHTGYQLPAISCNQRTFSALYCGSIRAIENVTQFVQPFQPTTNRLWLVLPLFPHYTAGVVEHSRLMNQNSLPSNTEKWCLCNNPNTSVSINKQCFP